MQWSAQGEAEKLLCRRRRRGAESGERNSEKWHREAGGRLLREPATTKGQQVVSALEEKSTCAEIALAWVEAADCEIMSC
jgi:hypothetical protein